MRLLLTAQRFLATGRNGEMTWRQRRALEKRTREEEDRRFQEGLASLGEALAALCTVAKNASASTEDCIRFFQVIHEPLEKMRRQREVGEI